MSDTIEHYRIAEDFAVGETLYVHALPGNVHCVGPHTLFGHRSREKIGVAVEPVFNEAARPDRCVALFGPEIRLYDKSAKVLGPVVGFVSSYKGERMPKAKSAFRRRLGRIFESDGAVFAVFMVIIFILGASIGCALTWLIAG